MKLANSVVKLSKIVVLSYLDAVGMKLLDGRWRSITKAA